MKAKELSAALRKCSVGFVVAACVSGLVNLLYLTGSFFMMQVYDRVLPSRSVPTLVGLLVLALTLYAAQGLLDLIRARILARCGSALDQALSGRMFDLVVRAPLRGLPDNAGLRPIRDLEIVRGFLSGQGPTALFDLPWMPIYIGICALFHPLIGLSALVGSLMLIAFTIATDRLTAPAARAAAEHGAQRSHRADSSRRSAEVIVAMGMQPALAMRWDESNRAYINQQMRVSDVTAGFGAASKTFRAVLQSVVLALGAWLVIENQATAGVIIAASILTSRAMAPAELAIANWKGLVQARQAWGRLHHLCALVPPCEELHELPVPRSTLVAEALSVSPPGTPRLVVQDVSLTLQAGQGVGIIGPSASGKSSLVRALVGVWPCLRGHVRLDGAALDQWTSTSLGAHVGYLPQEVELFAGTIAQNIARFRANSSSIDVIEAAQAAGVHELILALPKGYDTLVGENGAGLSAGQRQRIGLARALFGRPFLVVLDEPNSNLDSDGEQALTRAIAGVRERAGICVVVAHRPSALAALDMVLVMAAGRVQAFGPKNEVLMRVLQPAENGRIHPSSVPMPQQTPMSATIDPIRMSA